MWRRHNIESLLEWASLPFTKKIQMVEDMIEVARSIHGGKLPPLVGYMPKPWQPLNVLIAVERALASARSG